MDIEERIEAIIQVKRNREQAGHIWLQGFHEIINNSILDYKRINEYLSKKLSENPPFTKYHSSVQMFTLIQSLLNGLKEPFPIQDIDISSLFKNSKLAVETIRKKADEIDFFYAHLPVNKDYHLEFPLINQSGLCGFIYTTCERCEGLEEHGFPELTLRQSVYFESNAPTMYDNRISVNHQPPDLIKESYIALENFIHSCKIN